MELRPDDIQEILRIFADSDLEELHLDIGGTRLDLSKRGGVAAERPAPAPTPAPRPAPDPTAPPAQAPAAPAPSAASAAPTPAAVSPAPASASVDGLEELRSPLLGVFYRRPAPGEQAFVEIGSQVGADDPVCIIDVMKLFTRIPAGVAGRVVEICVEDGQLVEHGQVLMRIDPR